MPFVLAILIDVLWYHVVGFICIFLITKDAGHLFMYLFAIPIFSWMKCLCESCAHLFFSWVDGIFITAF